MMKLVRQLVYNLRKSEVSGDHCIAATAFFAIIYYLFIIMCYYYVLFLCVVFMCYYYVHVYFTSKELFFIYILQIHLASFFITNKT